MLLDAAHNTTAAGDSRTAPSLIKNQLVTGLFQRERERKRDEEEEEVILIQNKEIMAKRKHKNKNRTT